MLLSPCFSSCHLFPSYHLNCLISSRCTDKTATKHEWSNKNLLHFKNRSTWGGPSTLEVVITEIIERSEQTPNAEGTHRPTLEREIGLCWVDLRSLWDQVGDRPNGNNPVTSSHRLELKPINSIIFDEHGDIQEDAESSSPLELEITITTTRDDDKSATSNGYTLKRSLLYKHDDDLRQEMFAVQVIEACNRVLCSCGLDLKLLMYKVLAVGKRRGFVEWVPGSVPLSEICQPFAGSILGERTGSIVTVQSVDAMSSIAKAGIPKHQSLRRDPGDQAITSTTKEGRNPIQDYFRSIAHDPNAPYMIKKEVMDTYIKSCAGYSVITYLLVSPTSIHVSFFYFGFILNFQLTLFLFTSFLRP